MRCDARKTKKRILKKHQEKKQGFKESLFKPLEGVIAKISGITKKLKYHQRKITINDKD